LRANSRLPNSVEGKTRIRFRRRTVLGPLPEIVFGLERNDFFRRTATRTAPLKNQRSAFQSPSHRGTLSNVQFRQRCGDDRGFQLRLNPPSHRGSRSDWTISSGGSLSRSTVSIPFSSRKLFGRRFLTSSSRAMEICFNPLLIGEVVSDSI
jgi:hypothetical protein